MMFGGVRTVTDWTAWIRLIVAPSSYLFALALLATVIAKTISLLALRPPVEWWALPAPMLIDVGVFMGAAGACAWLEAYLRFADWLTIPVAAVVALLAALNAIYLALAGEQLSWSIFEIIVRQWAEAETMLRYMITPLLVAWLVLVVAVLSGVSIDLRRLLRCHGGSLGPAKSRTGARLLRLDVRRVRCTAGHRAAGPEFDRRAHSGKECVRHHRPDL